MIFSPRKKTQGTKYKIAVVMYMYYLSFNARVDMFPTQSHPYAHAQLLPNYVWCRCLGESQCVATKWYHDVMLYADFAHSAWSYGFFFIERTTCNLYCLWFDGTALQLMMFSFCDVHVHSFISSKFQRVSHIHVGGDGLYWSGLLIMYMSLTWIIVTIDVDLVIQIYSPCLCLVQRSCSI